MNQPTTPVENSNTKTVEDMRSLFKKNDQVADQTRIKLNERKIFGINLMGSPGSGKTTLLEGLIDQYQGQLSELGVLEGDLATERDADRIRNKGVSAQQISTGSVCHLSAAMVSESMEQLPLDDIKVLFVENVGNLVCPSKFALGTHKNIVAVSIPEGDDKPVKYPVMIRMADVVIFTKVDLLPHFDFDLERSTREIKEINPNALILQTDIKTKHGFAELWKEILGWAQKNDAELL